MTVRPPALRTRTSDHIIVIIGFDDTSEVCKMARHLQGFDSPPDIVVIENGKALYESVNFEVIRPLSNLGYTGAANVGISLAFSHGYSFVTIANADLDLDNAAFARLREALDNATADVAVFGGIELTADGKPNTVGGRSWSKWTGTDRWAKELAASEDMLFVQGAFVTVTRAIRAIEGPFDESLFMFFDEIELGLRVREAGLRTVVVPGLRYRHDNSRGRHRPLRGYLIWRNRSLVSRRHAGICAPLNHLIGIARLLCGVVARFPNIRPDYTKASLAGWWDGVRGVSDLSRVPGLKYVNQQAAANPLN